VFHGQPPPSRPKTVLPLKSRPSTRVRRSPVAGQDSALSPPAIRDNLERVDRDSGLYKRYVEKLNEQETQFETLQAGAGKAAEASRAASTAVDTFIASLTI
jgi:hypothetical protein